MLLAAKQISATALLLVALAATPSLARAGGPGAGGAPWQLSSSPKLDPQLAAEASSGQPMHVLVYGSGFAPLNSALHLSLRHNLNDQGAESATVDASDLSQLAASPGVQYVAPDPSVVPTGGPGAAAATQVSAAELQTIYPAVDGAPEAWADGLTGAGVGIAIIDSGVTQRADFGSRLVQVRLPAQDGAALNDQVGHGSAVAGVAAGDSPDGRYVGIAPGATVYAIDVAGSDGVYTSDVIDGLLWVLHHARETGIRVVNLSLSETQPSSPSADALDSAVEMLWRAGIVVVCSSGNLGPDSAQFAPGNDPFAITVGASDTADTATTADDTLASFSSFGQVEPGVSKPEIVAPGRHIVAPLPLNSTLGQEAPAANVVDPTNGYVRLSGTSFSAPQVAGAAALLLQANPSLTPDQVKWILVQGERPLAGSNAGALDLGLALSLAGSPGSANGGLQPSTWAHPGDSTAAFDGAGPGLAGLAQGKATMLDALANAVCARTTILPVVQVWEACARVRQQAAGAWDAAASAWNTFGNGPAAGKAAASGASDWQAAAAAWSASAAWDGSAAAYASAAWDAATVDQNDSAAWDSATWDSAAWDSAAWDSAAWDSAAWDSAAWDSATWD